MFSGIFFSKVHFAYVQESSLILYDDLSKAIIYKLIENSVFTRKLVLYLLKLPKSYFSADKVKNKCILK